MRTIVFSVIVLLAVTSCNQSKKESLFNGENLDGWTIFVDESIINPEDFFYVNDGMVETVGVPIGYLRTVKEFSDYKLHVEWRYPEEPTNSGVFLHTSGPDLLWPNHYQAQLMHGNAGDFIVHGSGISATIRDTVYTSTVPVKPVLPKLHPSSENPAGEWNSFDITCSGNTIEIYVNGVLQNLAKDCSISKGGIGLQAEGSKIQFRNLWIEQIK